MALETTTSRVSFSGNGSTTVFSFPYYFLAQTDLVVVEKVTATGVETTKTLTTHYTVSGAGVAAGGSVTMLVAPTSGTTLTVYRDNAVTQDLDLVENDSMPAEELEERLDKLTMIAQRAKNRLDRTVRLTEGFTTTFDPQLPALLTANCVVKVNSAGSAFEIGPSSASIESAEGSATAAAASATASANSATSAAASATASAASASAITTHEADTTAIHGITDTSVLALGVAAAVDSEIALFSSTGGKQLKRSTGSGIARLTSGVLSAVSNVALTSEVTGTLPVANGGTGAASLSANAVLLGNGTTAPQTVAPGTSGNVLTSNGTTWQSSAPSSSPVGSVIGRAITEYATYGSTATAMPADDTIPQSTEGGEITTLAYTPTLAASRLRITVSGAITAGATANAGVALFRDSTADAIAVIGVGIAAADRPFPFSIRTEQPATSTSSTTFKIRTGASGGETVAWNGVSGARKYGGVQKVVILIEEIKQ